MNSVSSKLFLSLLILVLWGLPASAQSPVPYQSTGLPNTIYSGGNVDSVDTTSGNLRITIPLVHLPGRGFDTDIVLSYNSKIWITNESIDPYTLYPRYQADADADSNWDLSPGWGIGVPRMGRYGNYATVCQLYYEPSGCVQWVDYIDWVTTDGTRVFMQDDVGKYGFGQGPFPGGIGAWSFDGTYVRFPGTPGNPFPPYLYNHVGRYKDGVKVAFPSPTDPPGPETLTDTNGNFISCRATCTDTLGRVITYNYEHLTSPIVTDRLQSVTYKDSSGTLQTVSFGYQNVSSYYPMTWLSGGQYTSQGNSCPYNDFCYLIDDDSPGRFLLTSVTLPNGKSYQFEYLPNVDTDAAGASTALLSKIILPTGGYIRYTYTNGREVAQYTAIASRVVSSDGTPASENTWTYVAGGGLPNSVSQVTDALGNIQVIQFDSHGWAPATITYKSPAGTVLRTITRTMGCDETAYNNVDVTVVNSGCSNPRVLSEITALNDTNQQSKVTYTYGTRGNVTAKSEYDWGSAAPGPLVRSTTFTYLHDSNSAYADKSVHILDRVLTQNVCNSGATFCGKKSFVYDGTVPSPTSNVVNHDYTAFPASYNLRGNPTATQVWLNTTSAWLTTTKVYNDVGNLVQTTDPGGHATSFSYGDNYYNYSPPQPTSAYLTTITRPTTSGVNHVTRNQYYFNSGLLAASCGENFPSGTTCSFGLTAPQSDYYSYAYDLLQRPSIANVGDGGQTTTCYSDTPGSGCYSASLPIKIATTSKINATTNLTTTAIYDALGRLKSANLTSDPQGPVYTRTGYDALGRKSLVWNPTRCDLTVDPPPSSCTGESTFGKTESQYDSLARTTKLIPPDGTSLIANVTISYTGNCTTVTDQAGKIRKSCTDGLGRLTQVFEPNSSGNPVNETDYQYDALDNLIRVDQQGNDSNSADWRTRTFVYNSLSQLTSATNPETGPVNAAGTIIYTYNDDGVLTSKSDPRGVTINYSPTDSPIDALHRVTKKTYSDSTPAVRYAYDGVAPSGCTLPTLTIHNGIGKRTGMCDGAGAEAWSWDITGNTGWKITDARTTNGVTKNTIYQNNFDGSLASLTYPSQRVITYVLAASGNNTASRYASAVDSGMGINYATGALYAPQGALSYVQNGAGFYSTFLFNSRLQPCWIYASTSSSGAPSTCTQTGVATAGILDSQYDFRLGTADNGNVNRITNRRNTSRSITYQYDVLNRIYDAVTDATSGQFCWGQLFGTQSGSTFTSGYDPWSNLTTITPDPNRPGCSVGTMSHTVNAYNKLVDSGYSYDNAGNMTADPATIATYQYDAENRLNSASSTLGSSAYLYDGDGRRVAKAPISQPTQPNKIYWYGMGSDPLDETDGAGNTNNSSFNEYISFNGKRIARRDSSNNVFYYFADHLGTSRVIVQSGQTTLCYDADYYPFGGEAVVVTNTCPQNYKFTGKERDSESGLDEFGARHYASTMGRWISPDAINITDERVLNPANTLNKYIYGGNNPLKYIDPDGRDITVFYTETGRAGHFWMVAYDQSTGNSAVMDFGPKNGDSYLTMAREPFGVPGDTNYQSHMTADEMRQDYTSLTIQTNPEDTQKAIQAINSFNSSNQTYNLESNNCTTVCRDVLHKILNLDSTSIRPKSLWGDIFKKWSNAALSNNGNKPVKVQSGHGIDYGQPRIGINTFELMWMLLNPPKKEVVTHKLCWKDDKGKQVCPQ
jgi:RHS repeat-associated protein